MGDDCHAPGQAYLVDQGGIHMIDVRRMPFWPVARRVLHGMAAVGVFVAGLFSFMSSMLAGFLFCAFIMLFETRRLWDRYPTGGAPGAPTPPRPKTWSDTLFVVLVWIFAPIGLWAIVKMATFLYVYMFISDD